MLYRVLDYPEVIVRIKIIDDNAAPLDGVRPWKYNSQIESNDEDNKKHHGPFRVLFSKPSQVRVNLPHRSHNAATRPLKAHSLTAVLSSNWQRKHIF
jgi:hypothetical protein